MCVVITWAAVAVIFLLLFVVGMLVGIVRKSVNTVILAVVLFLLGIAAAAVALYLFIS